MGGGEFGQNLLQSRVGGAMVGANRCVASPGV